MSGHNKWSTIKRKKGANDAARAKVFTKIGRELAVAVKNGGPDPNNNAKLRDVIAKAKQNNVPNDNIDRMLKKAAGEGDSTNFEEIVYEGYGPSGIAVVVETLTDNRNRTASDVRHVFDKAGGNLGTTGCVSYLFNKKGVIVIDKTSTDMSEDDLMLLALDSGAEDFEAEEEVYQITTAPEDFSSVREKLEAQGLEFLEAEVQMVPTTYVALDEKGEARMQRLIDMLDDLDDVTNVYHNWDE